jgi:hypothetical protein
MANRKSSVQAGAMFHGQHVRTPFLRSEVPQFYLGVVDSNRVPSIKVYRRSSRYLLQQNIPEQHIVSTELVYRMSTTHGATLQKQIREISEGQVKINENIIVHGTPERCQFCQSLR